MEKFFSLLTQPLPFSVVQVAIVFAVVMALIGWGSFLLTMPESPGRHRARLTLHALVASVPVFAIVSMLVFTCWISDREFGLSRTKMYGTGVYLAPVEPLLQLPKTGTVPLVDGHGISRVDLQFLVKDEKKLQGLYGEMVALSDSSGMPLGSNLIEKWIWMKAVSAVSQGRQLLAEPLRQGTTGPDAATVLLTDLQRTFEPYGIEVILFVRQEYVLKQPSIFEPVAE